LVEFPHYFIPAEGGGGPGAQVPIAPLAHAIDSFLLESSLRRPTKVIVGLHEEGGLGWVMGDQPRDMLSAQALSELHLDEVGPPARQRTIVGESLYVMDLELVEQVASGPELNDPVYAYGTLLGPVGTSDAVRVRG